MSLFVLVIIFDAIPKVANAGFLIQEIGTLGGNRSFGMAVSNSGVVTGQAETSSGYGHAIRFSNGTLTDLGAGGKLTSYGRAINNNGDIAGSEFDAPDVNERALLYSGGGMTSLGGLGGNRSEALGINDDETVVGTGSFSNGAISTDAIYRWLRHGVSWHIRRLQRSSMGCELWWNCRGICLYVWRRIISRVQA